MQFFFFKAKVESVGRRGEKKIPLRDLKKILPENILKLARKKNGKF